MFKSKEAFTLVEVVIAMFILMIGLLALLNTAAVIIENNLINILRDEAVRIGEQKMDELRNSNPAAAAWPSPCPTVQRVVRSVNTTFTVCSQVTNLSADGNTRQLDVAVGWDYKGTGTITPTIRKYQHSLSSVVRFGS